MRRSDQRCLTKLWTGGAAPVLAAASILLVAVPWLDRARAQDIMTVPGISIHGATAEPATTPAPKPPAKPEAAKTATPQPAKKKKAVPKAATPAKPVANTTTKRTAAIGKANKPRRRSRSIVVLVNDEPITNYEIEQRAAFIALRAGSKVDMKSKAEARWRALVKSPKTNERFKKLLREKGVRTQEEAKKVQKQFVKDLQKEMLAGIRREARAKALASSKSKAQDELIEEKLKLQEAKKLSVVASKSQVDKIISGIAERNKMSIAQFGKHMKSMGVDINTMRSRFKANISWRDVVRRRFGHQIAIADKDIDRMVATGPAVEDGVELKLHRISIFTPPKADQKAVAQKLSEAQLLATRFTGCSETKALASQLPGARFQDLGTKKPSAIPEPTRSMLLSAADGDMLPPVIADGSVELWAVCERKVVSADDKKRQDAKATLRSKEFEIMARKHLKDLRQDASIEYR